MPNKTGINRREFLLSTSAAALGMTAVSGAAPAEAEVAAEFQSPSGSLIPYARHQLTEDATQRILTGPRLAETAFPLGGIGTGTVSLGGHGELRDWEIFNRPAKGRSLPFSFVALWVKPASGKASMRVVRGPMPPPFRGWNGLARESTQGIPHFRGATFTGTYPIATVEFEDDTLPVDVSLEAFTPCIPLNVEDSNLPVAILKYRLTNRTQEAVDASLAFSLLNPVGYDGKAFLKGNEHPGFGKNRTTVRESTEGGIKLAGLDMTSDKYATGDPRSGSMALLTTHPTYTARNHWKNGEWRDFYSQWMSDYMPEGKLHDSEGPALSEEGKSNSAMLAPYVRLLPGESTTITFILAWYFPVRENYWHDDDPQMRGKRLTNYYGTRFQSAWDIASHTARRLPELESNTRLFTNTLFASTLPACVVDAVSSQMSILRTNTCILLEGKQFFAFEGCADDEHNGWMNCSHVWNYEQALAFLYPDLERSMRNTDFLYEMRSDDSMAFRSMVPLGIKQWDFRPAADGQMGCILKLYREWQISGDTEFLKQMWPGAKRALEFAWKFWDVDKDGVMEGVQHNTYDIEFFGANPMMTTLYLGALKAGEIMATALGDTAAAARYQEVWGRGQKNIENLWNGEFYIQKVTPVGEIQPMPPYDKEDWKKRVVEDGQLKYQFGDGCLSDQMLGQWFADVIGLDIGLQPDRVRTALLSIYRNNFQNDFWQQTTTQRIYAVNDDKGLLLCSWPRGGRPALPFIYSDEVWTGVEYQVAAHLIYRGMIEEGLSIVKAVGDRYDGERRNPWDQLEWGNHYSRAMASYSLLTALSGYQYSAIERSLAFMPRINADNFSCFFSAGSGWGRYTQTVQNAGLEVSLDVLHGKVPLQHLKLGNAIGANAIAVSALTGTSGGQPPRVRMDPQQDSVHLEFASPVSVAPGNPLSFRLSSSGSIARKA